MRVSRKIFFAVVQQEKAPGGNTYAAVLLHNWHDAFAAGNAVETEAEGAADDDEAVSDAVQTYVSKRSVHMRRRGHGD